LFFPILTKIDFLYKTKKPPNVKFYENPWIRRPDLTTGGGYNKTFRNFERRLQNYYSCTVQRIYFVIYIWLKLHEELIDYKLYLVPLFIIYSRSCQNYRKPRNLEHVVPNNVDKRQRLWRF